MKKWFALCSLVLGALFVMPNSADAEVAVGDVAPDFELVGSDGKTYKSEQFEGEKVVVIAWYPKAFTGG